MSCQNSMCPCEEPIRDELTQSDVLLANLLRLVPHLNMAAVQVCGGLPGSTPEMRQRVLTTALSFITHGRDAEALKYLSDDELEIGVHALLAPLVLRLAEVQARKVAS